MIFNIIVVKELSKEDKALAKKYNVSPAKISYIKEITSKNKKISIDNLVEMNYRIQRIMVGTAIRIIL